MDSPTAGELTNGLDWADGQNGRVGTPTPPDAIEGTTAAGTDSNGHFLIPIEELPGYPTIERGEQATIVHKFSMSWAEALTQIAFIGRGTMLEDSFGNVSRVLTATIERTKGGPGINQTWATMTITSESISFDMPPDDFRIVEVELGVNIIKYPRYFYAFYPTSTLDGNFQKNRILNQAVIRVLQNYFENTTVAYRDAMIVLLNQSIGYPGTVTGATTLSDGSLLGGTAKPGASFPVTLADGTPTTVTPVCGTDLAKYAAMEIISKYWNNEETPYIVGYEIEWDAYYFRPPYLNPGGYVENPIYQATPQLPDYFWSPAYPPNLTTVFDNLASINPQCYSNTGTTSGSAIISWLRKSDRYDYQRTWFKVTRRWMGTPIGFWDPDLFNQNNAPWATNGATHYDVISIPQLNQQDVVNLVAITAAIVAGTIAP